MILQLTVYQIFSFYRLYIELLKCSTNRKYNTEMDQRQAKNTWIASEVTSTLSRVHKHTRERWAHALKFHAIQPFRNTRKGNCLVHCFSENMKTIGRCHYKNDHCKL